MTFPKTKDIRPAYIYPVRTHSALFTKISDSKLKIYINESVVVLEGVQNYVIEYRNNTHSVQVFVKFGYITSIITGWKELNSEFKYKFTDLNTLKSAEIKTNRMKKLIRGMIG